MSKKKGIEADPYLWPFNGNLSPSNTVFMVIDMQHDFCGKGGYVDSMDYDISLTRRPIQPIQNVLTCMRQQGYHIMHTREGYLPDLSDCPPSRQWRTKQVGGEIGSMGPCGRLLIRGEQGWDIIPEVYPLEGELIIDKPSRGSFVNTDLHSELQTRGICNIILAGVTTDVCVHSTMRMADDLGYECLLLEDCCAATEVANHEAAIAMIKTEGGVFGAVSDSTKLLAALNVTTTNEA
jgi:nicotinamidase-related amidase